MKTLKLITLAVSALFFVSCGPKKTELEKEVDVFLKEWQTKLDQGDEEILKLFATKMSKEDVLTAVHILQNKADDSIKVQVWYDSAHVEQWFNETNNTSSVGVIIPVRFSLMGRTDLSEQDSKTSIAFELVRKDKQFLISNLLVNDRDHNYAMYSKFTYLQSLKTWLIQSRENERLRENIFALQRKYGYDSLVAYISHQRKMYFYAVKGDKTNWFNGNGDNFLSEGHSIGLIDEDGKVIVPLEFDLVGTPSINLPDAVEVTKNGKIGYYSMEGKELVPPLYEWLIPYSEYNVVALAKKDSVTYGWFDTYFTWHDSLPSEKAEEAVNTLSFLDRTFSPFEYDLALHPETQSRFVFPPAVYVKYGFANRYTDGFSPWGSGDETGYSLTRDKETFSLMGTISSWLMSVSQYYTQGRGWFYDTRNQLVVAEKDRLIAKFDFSYEKLTDYKIEKINDSLFQCSYHATPYYEGDGEYYEGDEVSPEEIEQEIDRQRSAYGFYSEKFPSYLYFNLKGELRSKRQFNFTQFVRLDSSYLSGDFTVYYKQNGKWVEEKASFVSNRTQQLMYDEILAFNGFIFEEEEKQKYYKYRTRDIQPVTTSYDEVYAKASETDRYNLDFLMRLLTDGAATAKK